MTTLRSKLIGSWELIRFESHDPATGYLRQPLGPEPRGLILYTADGFMSAQLEPDPAGAELGGYIAYTGPFEIDEETAIVHHQVRMATMPDLLAAPQLREVRIDGDLLALSATSTDAAGATTRSTLTWRRAIR